MFKTFGFVVLCGFALVGVAFTGVFTAMQFGLLNVKGSIASRNAYFEAAPNFGTLTKTANASSCVQQLGTGEMTPICGWNQSEEWSVIAAGLTKDEPTIKKVAVQTGVDPRMIAAAVVPEQLRFFTAERESYKKYFEPLKVLGSMSKFSLGVSGMKQDTAKAVEQHLADTNGNFYTGADDAALLTYPAGADHDKVMFDRLTDAKDHYYSYLYTALYLKQIQAQWAKSGYDVAQRPDVLTTLFNIGFASSKPKSNPQIGGSAITVGGKTYTFGLLGTDFYRSDELSTIFPHS